MLKNSLLNTEPGVMSFGHVFQEARVLGDWVENSKAFRKYIKNFMKLTVVTSRFVDPNCTAPYIDRNLFKSLETSNCTLKSNWKSEIETLHEQLNHSILVLIFEKIEETSSLTLSKNTKQIVVANRFVYLANC